MIKTFILGLAVALSVVQPYVFETYSTNSRLFEIQVEGKNILDFSFGEYRKATNEHPDVEFKVALIYTTVTTNTTMQKEVNDSYGCLLIGCTKDHSFAYWKQETREHRKRVAEIAGQKFTLEETVVILGTTNFVPVSTATGMVFQATQIAPSLSNLLETK